MLPSRIIPLSDTTTLTSLRSKNIFVGCPVPSGITIGVVADNENGDPEKGAPLPSVTVTKNGVVSAVDK